MHLGPQVSSFCISLEGVALTARAGEGSQEGGCIQLVAACWVLAYPSRPKSSMRFIFKLILTFSAGYLVCLYQVSVFKIDGCLQNLGNMAVPALQEVVLFKKENDSHRLIGSFEDVTYTHVTGNLGKGKIYPVVNASDRNRKQESNCVPCEPQRVPVDPHYHPLFNDPPATLLLLSQEAKLMLQNRPRKNRIAIVTFVSVDTMEISDRARDSYLPLVSHRECYCLKWGYDCHVELQALDKRIVKGGARIHFNKVLTVRKYLPFYDWVFFADADSYFIMDRPIENLIVPGKSIYFESCDLPNNFVRAGYFLMKNTHSSYEFLEDWYDFARHKILYCNGDAGVLNLVLLQRVKGYDGSCLQYVKNCTAYREGEAKKCVERFLTKETDFGDVDLNAELFIPIRNKLLKNPGKRVAYHGKTLVKDLLVNISALSDCMQYLS